MASNNPTSSAFTMTEAAPLTLNGDRCMFCNDSDTAESINSFGVSRRHPMPTVIVGGRNTSVIPIQSMVLSVITTFGSSPHGNASSG